MIKGKVALEICKKYQKHGSLTLAKKLYAENVELYKDVEEARKFIRYYRGKCGASNRQKLATKDVVENEARSKNVWSFIPEEHNESPKIWRLPSNFNKVLLISDIHLPYHSTSALKACFEYAKKEKIDCIYINGDLLDFFGLSFHEKDARKRPSISEELKMGYEFLKGLKDYFKCPIYYKPANHEHRLERYLTIKAPELLDCDEFRLDVLLKLGELGINYINRRDKCYFGELLVEHGDRIKGSGGVNPARTLFTKYKRHTICGHFHRKSEHSAKIYDGKCIVTFSVASLCDLEPEYFEVNEHVNGFAIVEMNGKEFHVRNYTIENGRVY